MKTREGSSGGGVCTSSGIISIHVQSFWLDQQADHEVREK